MDTKEERMMERSVIHRLPTRRFLALAAVLAAGAGS